MNMDIEARVRRAEELFHEGYNCSQSVVLAFADLTGVDEALLEKISIGLGGGVGRLREVCGAVSGMAMVAVAAMLNPGITPQRLKHRAVKKIVQHMGT